MIGAGLLANSMNNQMMRDDLADASARRLEKMASGPMDAGKAKAVAKEFESLFITQMLEHMFSGDSLGEDLFGNAETDEIYQGMMTEQYGDAIGKAGGIGIARKIEESLIARSLMQQELLKTQEVPDEPAIANPA